jgi:hypothetical protein
MKSQSTRTLTAAGSSEAAAAGAADSSPPASLALAAWASSKAVLKRLASGRQYAEIDPRSPSCAVLARRTLRVAESDGKGLGGRLSVGVVGKDVPHPRSVGSDVGRQLLLGGDCESAACLAMTLGGGDNVRTKSRAMDRRRRRRRRRGQSHSLMWLAQIFRVLSLRMSNRTFPVSLFLSSRTSPVPRSFHSASALMNRKSLARLKVSDRRDTLKAGQTF